MAALTPPPWRLKIRTSLGTRLLVFLEDPAAIVGDLRGEKNKRQQDATALQVAADVDDAGHGAAALEIFSTP